MTPETGSIEYNEQAKESESKELNSVLAGACLPGCHWAGTWVPRQLGKPPGAYPTRRFGSCLRSSIKIPGAAPVVRLALPR